jgi:Flp pilus assembly protein TadG
MSRLSRLLRRVLGDERANISILFAFVMVPTILFAGFAVDYSRGSLARVTLQNAADATVLTLARGDTTDSALLKAAAQQRMSTMVPEWYDFEVNSVTRDGSKMTLNATGEIPAGVSGIIGLSTLDQTVSSEVIWGTGKLEVALVLDNTGSMGSYGRMAAMKDAAEALLDEIATSETGLVKVSIVPFDVNVRVPTSYKTASWFKTEWWVNWFWKGCLTDRDQPYDIDDTAVTNSATKYPPALCTSNTLATIQPLTDDFDDLYQKVGDMAPAGNTNITIGLSWGLATLSAQQPFTEGVAWGAKDVSKVIVLMTDGDNTENRWSHTASQIDQRTELACQSVKDAGVILYTVRLTEGNADLLSACASSIDTYYDVENVQDLVPAFRAIGEELTALRLSK